MITAGSRPYTLIGEMIITRDFFSLQEVYVFLGFFFQTRGLDAIPTESELDLRVILFSTHSKKQVKATQFLSQSGSYKSPLAGA